jgi:hypothetical protein
MSGSVRGRGSIRVFAALILYLARTGRFAIADSLTRNERATSSTLRPPRSWRVSATRCSGRNAGENQSELIVLHGSVLSQFLVAGIMRPGRYRTELLVELDGRVDQYETGPPLSAIATSAGTGGQLHEGNRGEEVATCPRHGSLVVLGGSIRTAQPPIPRRQPEVGSAMANLACAAGGSHCDVDGLRRRSPFARPEEFLKLTDPHVHL